MSKSLVTIASMRDSHFSFPAEADQAVGAAIRYWGPEIVMTVVPLEIDT